MCVWVWWRWRVCMKNTRRSEVRRALRKGNQTPGTKPPPLAMLARHVYEGRSHAFSVACVCCESRVGGLCGARKRRNRRREPSPATEERGNAGKAMQLSNQVCTFSFFSISATNSLVTRTAHVRSFWLSSPPLLLLSPVGKPTSSPRIRHTVPPLPLYSATNTNPFFL